MQDEPRSNPKKFSRSLWERYDQKARDAVKRYLYSIQNIDLAADNVDKYGPDLVIVRDEKTLGYAECEVKESWHGIDIPWPTLHIPARKDKFTRLGLPIYFFVLNADLTWAWVVPKPHLVKCQKVFKKTMYTPEGEWFYEVPLGDNGPGCPHLVPIPVSGFCK